jgi:predicted nucleic acid-binding protein
MAVTVLDAGVLIGVLKPDDAHHDEATGRVTTALNERRSLLLSAASYAEALVHPTRRGPEAVAAVDAFLDQAPVHIVQVDRAVARAAALLRSHHGKALLLPDAFVLATAQVSDDDEAQVLTTDAGWPDVGLRVVILGARP